MEIDCVDRALQAGPTALIGPGVPGIPLTAVVLCHKGHRVFVQAMPCNPFNPFIHTDHCLDVQANHVLTAPLDCPECKHGH